MSNRPSGPKVFVVDDDPVVLDSLQLLLSSAGLEAEGFSSAPALLESKNLNAAGCLVIDVRLPGMSGLELVRRLRLEGRGIPAILITGHFEALADAQAEADGILAVLHKPFTAEELLGWVERAFQISAAGGGRRPSH